MKFLEATKNQVALFFNIKMAISNYSSSNPSISGRFPTEFLIGFVFAFPS
jgi:hypothetical protein